MANIIEEINLSKQTALNPALADLILQAGEHSAFQQLRSFGEKLKRQALDERELKVFFATLWGFFEAFPTGILALALRVTDDWSSRDPWEATAKGAYVLFADVDEFGLQEVNRKIHRSHHQMFMDFTEHLGVTRADMQNPALAMPEGAALGKLVARLYREAPLAHGLGMHLASELIASVEFMYFLAGFEAQAAAYGLSEPNHPALTFFRIHTLVEPEHLARNCELIEQYLDRKLIDISGLRQGIDEYFNGFEQVYRQFNSQLLP
ncbi:iron-containing redox enzyme family protein [Chromobacterium sp. IIBBL 290-4]|uniref:iron-containing redox enzyme family protein n=1 Tax=Chromobacterium sp. IIBBL 290-4 TaxID=2953890 RepID=UPI0020B74694|nr:iron-containing redox enzyme family protein [Chromobacterium sp. IIBBL 290-4]UTH73658.1 hypothetical protein NKT35_19260 [Chromobacterium sp. IIBBL 290-4]